VAAFGVFFRPGAEIHDEGGAAEQAGADCFAPVGGKCIPLRQTFEQGAPQEAGLVLKEGLSQG